MWFCLYTASGLIFYNRFLGAVSSSGLVTPTESQTTRLPWRPKTKGQHLRRPTATSIGISLLCHDSVRNTFEQRPTIGIVFVLGFGSTILEYLYLGDDISDGLLPRGVIGVDMSTTYEITPAATSTEHGGVIHDPSSIEAGSNMAGDFPSGAGSDNLTTSGSDRTGDLPSGDESGESTSSSDNSTISLLHGDLLCNCTCYTV
ncbi:hypothetical protein EV421DRAFT_1742999 [Armillaria borealis]|uniref:Uncharacterized protein n=1 Tax=Armillaria borealis TaxID=47425 RepID=A0AA39IXJ2_9AGAR|nr:hypothetical protein EV421DRAFT_1742999 [Armillaria borealis]